MRRLLTMTVAVLATLAFATVAEAKPHGPDLTIIKARVGNGQGAGGSYRIRNIGDRRARGTLAAVRIGDFPAWREHVDAIKPGRSRAMSFIGRFGLPVGVHPVKVCADATKRIREQRERNNCRSAGSITITPFKPSSVPTKPVAYTPDERFYLPDGGGYWAWVPSSYDATHQTPTKLFVWLHGCGGENKWDVVNVAPPPTGNYIAIAPDGREADCWDTGQDPPRVLAAIDDVRTHFNISPQRVVLGGYSSGGDLAYRTAFYNSQRIAGVISENTAPFAHIGVTTAQAIAAAQFRFRVVHLHHTEDDVYTTSIINQDIADLQGAGFPTTFLTRPGEHWENDTTTTGTNHDLISILLPYLNEDWTSPGIY